MSVSNENVASLAGLDKLSAMQEQVLFVLGLWSRAHWHKEGIALPLTVSLLCPLLTKLSIWQMAKGNLLK